MAFEDRKGDWLVVRGCGMSHLDSAKLISNVTRIWDKSNSLC